jgi:hypothetical protein
VARRRLEGEQQLERRQLPMLAMHSYGAFMAFGKTVCSPADRPSP